MHILVVDDVYTNRVTLQAMLEGIGHTVTCAGDGVEGVAEFDRVQPDVVLMDVVMPNMDGYEATRIIKRRSSDRFVPVIFITALSSTDDLVKCIEVGGDDFLARPFNIDLLKAKIVALNRMVSFYANLRAHEHALEQHNRRLGMEMRIGQNVLTKIMRQGIADDPSLRHWSFPMGMFSGDLFLSARTPAGGMNIMLGDITGHGLSAAIGAQPVADMFYSMTAKGFAIGDIAGEINRRMYATLHPEIFCAACLIELDPHRTTAMLWNGAMPDAFIVNTETGEQRRVVSSHQALGVVAEDRFNRRSEILSIGPADRIFICSDGFIEGKNSAKERFGMARLASALAQITDWTAPLENFKSSFLEFLGSQSPTDDVSMIEVICKQPTRSADKTGSPPKRQDARPARWQAEITLHADTLQVTNPVPVITGLIMQVQSPHSHRERIFTIVSELVTNAVDHGLLNLSSELKRGPEGFATYFQRRADALASLTEGWIRIRIDHVPEADHGVLTIHVEDSGSGFDVRAHQARFSTAFIAGSYSGRGLGLVRKLCASTQFNAAGNAVEAVYRWSR